MTAAVAISALVVTAAGATVRLVLGPSLVDRVIALDVMLISVMGMIAVQAARTGVTTYLDLLVAVAIVGFTATVAASRFIEHGAERQ